MINYEEELKKFHSSLDVNEAEDAIYNRDLTDITDILKELMKDEKKKNPVLWGFFKVERKDSLFFYARLCR